MTLLELRTQFVTMTGRNDLVVDLASYADNGVDFYIQAGQRMLDRMLEFPKSEAELSFTLTTDDVELQLASTVKSVLEIVLEDASDESMRYLTKVPLRDLRDLYGVDFSSLSAVDSGEPLYYALGHLRIGTATPTTETQKLVYLLPPPDAAYVVRVKVKMASEDLSANADESFWSIMHPDTLLTAAMYKLEVMEHRNREGAASYMEELRRAVADIEADVIEEETAEFSELGSSWRFIDEPTTRYDRHTNLNE